MTATRAGRHRTVVVVAAMATGLLAPADASAGCAAVRKQGRWTAMQLPAGVSEPTGMTVAFGTKSKPDAVYVPAGRRLLRTVDGGCSWQEAASLDTTVPETSLARKLPTYAITSVAVSNVAGSTARTIWALAVDPAVGGFAVALPAVVLVSKDDGRHWTVREQPSGPEAAEYPRCSSGSQGTRILAGPDASTAYLVCGDSSLATFLLIVGKCATALYVTHDSAATWRPVIGRIFDPTRVADPSTQFGCTQVQGFPQPDARRARVLWNLSRGVVTRSDDDGASAKQYATTPELGPTEYVQAFDAGTLPSGGPAVVVRTNYWLYLATAPGKAAPLPPLPVKVSERGLPAGAEVLDGAGLVFVPYVDGRGDAQVYLYDVVRRRWQQTERPPQPLDKSPMWDWYVSLAFAHAPSSRNVYLADSNHPMILRYVR